MSFKQIAKERTTLSPLMAGRDQMKTIEIVNNYPNGVTIAGFDYVQLTKDDGTADVVPVMIFEEIPNCFIFGGAVLRSLCDAWIEATAGDVAAASDGVAAEHIKIKLVRAKTRKGRDVTSVEVLD